MRWCCNPTPACTLKCGRLRQSRTGVQGPGRRHVHCSGTTMLSEVCATLFNPPKNAVQGAYGSLPPEERRLAAVVLDDDPLSVLLFKHVGAHDSTSAVVRVNHLRNTGNDHFMYSDYRSSQRARTSDAARRCTIFIIRAEQLVHRCRHIPYTCCILHWHMCKISKSITFQHHHHQRQIW